MYNAAPILLIIPILISLFFLAAPAAFLCTVLLLLFFDFVKTKEVFSILITALLFFAGLLLKACYLIFSPNHSISFASLLRSLLTCSLTLAVFMLIKFALFTYKENH